MARAIQLARRGLYSTSPNPRVGCVLLKNGKIIGEGFHQQAGRGHAEVNALAAAREAGCDVAGATAYVTLEPCSHHGKTPPCADALVAAGVRRVVIGMLDPNPLVSGRGIARLADAGIEVHAPLLEDEARALNPGFIKRMETGLPWVFAKTASSLDGRTAMRSGESQWITGPAARADVQKLRARSCAIVTGMGTVREDNPALTVRDESLALPGMLLRQPLRVILDSQLRIDPAAKILEQPGNVLLVHASDNPAKQAELNGKGVETVQLANAEGRIDLQALLQELAGRQCNEVMLESGATLLGAFLQAGLVDELVCYQAPCLLGSDARPLAELPLTAMAEKIALDILSIRQVGDDIRIQARPYYAKAD